MKKLNNVLSASIVLFLISCASPKPGTPEFAQKKEEDQQKAAVETVKQTISKIPVWYTTPPVDINSFYQTGSHRTTDLQSSIDHAVLFASHALSRRLSQRVSSVMNNIAEESGTLNDVTTQRNIETAGRIVADTKLVGYTVEKSEVVQEGQFYRSFVLLKYPLNENNKIIVEQVKKNADLDRKFRASKALEQLERAIEDAKVK